MPKSEAHVRAIADTNIVVSGLLWHGAPRQVLEAARSGIIQLYTSLVLLAEFVDVLQRPKFARRLALAQVTPENLVSGYAALATVILPAAIPRVIASDPDDDAVIACAVGAQAEVVVSGDRDLLDLQSYGGITIVTAAELLVHLGLSPT